MDVSAQLKWSSALVGLIGLWLIVGPPFLFEAPFSDFWSDLIVGFALLALAIYTYARRTSASSQWAMAAATIFGGWLILSAFLWQTSTLLQWNDLLTGGIVAVLAGYSAYEARETYASDGSEDDSGGSDGDSNGDSSGSDGSDGSSDDSDGSNDGNGDSDESNGDSSDGSDGSNGEDGDDSESSDDSSNDDSDDSDDDSNGG